MSQIKLSENFIKSNVKLALNEDLYPSGDITSDLIENDNPYYAGRPGLDGERAALPGWRIVEAVSCDTRNPA